MTDLAHGFDLSLFREPQRARRDLEQLRSLLPDKFFDGLLRLLADCPDPDQAFNLFERLTAQRTGDLIPLLESNRVLLHYLIALFGHSYWLGEALLHNFDLIGSLSRDRHLDRPREKEDYREGLARFIAQSGTTDISAVLARFRKREYIRIVLRDVLGLATLAETTGEISELTDVILEAALRHAQGEMQGRYGPSATARFSVISLGKLGGNELNYSSDIDLLYLYSGNSSDPAVLREYFVHQAQLLTDILCRTTREGPVFRIDLRLRPQGREGEPAIALRQALDYYAHAAQDWELQALIKARCSAGDPEPVRQFTRAVQARIYTDKLNFAAIETALLARERIGARRREASRRVAVGVDIKLDPGGIRDIEFLVQCLQRVYGGEEKWLRSGGTLFSLQKLHDKGHISGKDLHELTLAYTFLRNLEHRLQLQRGQQTHRLPAGIVQLQVLRRAVRMAEIERTKETGGELVAEVQARMAAVRGIYQRVIHQHRHHRREKAESLPAPPRAASAREMSFAHLLERLAMDSPALQAIASRADLSLHARRNLHRFLSSAMTSAARLAPLIEDPQRLEHALALLETSEYLTDILVRHPDAVTVLEQRELSPADAQPPLDDKGSEDPLAHLRRGFRKYSFALGARDVLSPRPTFQSLRENSRIADVVIRLALKIAGGDRSLAVFALGRLGTEEFDIASDADLLFLRPADAEEEDARVSAEGLVHAVAAYTREGSVFAVDTRLRPHGGEGELVTTPQQLERYLAEEAQPWEALTYTKLRFVAGREDLKPQVLASVWHCIVELAAQPGFTQAVREMRGRLEKTNRYPRSFKLARGGFYDIDFITSYLMLRRTSIAEGNTLDRLEHLREADLLDEATAGKLERAAILYRTADHVIRLVTGRARPELPEAEHARAAVEELVGATIHCSSDLRRELQDTTETVRQIFDQIVSE